MRIILTAFLVCLATAVAAEQVKTTATIRLFDTVLTFAPPPWTSGPDWIDQVETFENRGQTANDTRIFIQEFIPVGESFDSWSRLYAVSAETPLSGTLDGYRVGQVGIYTDACVDAQSLVSRTTPADRTLFTVFCPRYKANPDQGEVAFFSMMMQGETLVKTYYHIRVPAFTAADLAGTGQGLPLPESELVKAITATGQARLIEAE
jgi:hypothetical protein